MGIQAYLLWEKAGRPDGADFSGDARNTLQQQLASGMSLEQLEKALKEPSPQVATLPKNPCACVHACLQGAYTSKILPCDRSNFCVTSQALVCCQVKSGIQN